MAAAVSERDGERERETRGRGSGGRDGDGRRSRVRLGARGGKKTSRDVVARLKTQREEGGNRGKVKGGHRLRVPPFSPALPRVPLPVPSGEAWSSGRDVSEEPDLTR